MVAPLPRGLGTLSGICTDRTFQTGTVPSNSGQTPVGLEFKRVKSSFRGALWVCKLKAAPPLGDATHRPGRAALWALQGCSSLSLRDPPGNRRFLTKGDVKALSFHTRRPRNGIQLIWKESSIEWEVETSSRIASVKSWEVNIESNSACLE